MSAANNNKRNGKGNKKTAKMSFSSVADTNKPGEDIVGNSKVVETDLIVGIKAEIDAEAEELHQHLLSNTPEHQQSIADDAKIILENADKDPIDEDLELSKIIRTDVKQWIINSNFTELKEKGLPVKQLTDMIIESVRANEDLMYTVKTKSKENKVRGKVKDILNHELTFDYAQSVIDSIHGGEDAVYLASQNKIVVDPSLNKINGEVTDKVVKDDKKKKKKEKYVSRIQPSAPDNMYRSVVEFRLPADSTMDVESFATITRNLKLPC